MTTLTVTMGLPAAGKTTIAATLPGEFVSTDLLRVDRTIQRAQWIHDLTEYVVARLAVVDMVVDSCAIHAPSRLRWLDAALRAGAAPHLLVVHCHPDLARARNRARPHRVPPRDMSAYIRAWSGALAATEGEPWASVTHRQGDQPTPTTQATPACTYTTRDW